MKAVILSGGRGSRLSPLTDKKPKPLVTVGSRTLIEILLETLAENGITECAVTLGYRGDDIKNVLGDICHGIKITYFEEKVPLGTAGGVKNCESFLDEDFVVMSADALCQLDLKALAEHHEKSKDIATIVLTPSNNVLEYGVVLCDKYGKVTGFTEKPAWEEVKSDLVNCGIYMFRREILDMIPKNVFWDFSENLFPKMLAENQKINTYVNNSFWCDVGNISTLYFCNMKTLSKNFFVRHIPDSSNIHESAVVLHSVIGRGTKIDADCVVKNVVMGNNCKIGKKCHLEECIIADGVTLEKGVCVEKGSVIADNSFVSQNTLIASGQKIGADTRIENDGYTISLPEGSVSWQSGIVSIDQKNPENFFKLGRAAVSQGKLIGIFYSFSQTAYLGGTEFALGIAWQGGEGVIFGEGCESDARFCAGAFGIPVFHFKERDNGLIVTPFSPNSTSFTRQEERKLISSYTLLSDGFGDGSIKYFDGWEILEKQYFLNLLGNTGDFSKNVAVKSNSEGKHFAKDANASVNLSSDKGEYDFFMEISDDRKNISLSFLNRNIDTEHIHALIIKSLISKGRKHFCLPDDSPRAFETIAENRRAKITKTGKSFSSAEAFYDLWARDAFFASALLYRVLEEHSFSSEKLEKSVCGLPVFLCMRKELETKGVSAGYIMRQFGDEKNFSACPDGTMLRSKFGEVKITPCAKNRFKIFAEANTAETALELCISAEELIEKMQKRGNLK